MSKIIVKKEKISNYPEIVDSFRKLFSGAIFGEFFEEENGRSFASVEEAMEYLDQLFNPTEISSLNRFSCSAIAKFEGSHDGY